MSISRIFNPFNNIREIFYKVILVLVEKTIKRFLLLLVCNTISMEIILFIPVLVPGIAIE